MITAFEQMVSVFLLVIVLGLVICALVSESNEEIEVEEETI